MAGYQIERRFTFLYEFVFLSCLIKYALFKTFHHDNFHNSRKTDKMECRKLRIENKRK